MNIKQYVFKYDIDQFLLLNKLYVLLLCLKKKLLNFSELLTWFIKLKEGESFYYLNIMKIIFNVTFKKY